MGDQEPVAAGAAVQEALDAVLPGEPPAVIPQIQAQDQQGGAERVGDRPQPADPVLVLGEINRCLALLEEKRLQSVEAILFRLRTTINRVGAEFSKEEAFDLLIEWKSTATSEGHKNTAHFKAVNNALKTRLTTPPEQFKRYLAALIGDKEQEKVLGIMSKVDKSLKLDRDLKSAVGTKSNSNSPSSSPGPARAQGTTTRRPLRCFYCERLGHTQARCFQRIKDEERDSEHRDPKIHRKQ